ncbi:MAG: GAF domain-containing protein [Sphaerochaetaceae bacterium]|nr:GAF domain-containing protein [Sphaerochaetaceae bacterium]MDC7250676.1 GAF domain-containing protein [Sphaerochaetaceae bacterium]
MGKKEELEALLESYDGSIESRYCSLSNAVAFLKSLLVEISWIGFYIKKDSNLVLGPFQGNIACEIIPFTKGVCGDAYTSKKTINVDNVNLYENHIACESDTSSELVIPLIKKSRVVAVLDIDSKSFSRFKDEEIKLLEELADVIAKKLF